jgi:hypothetical protein
MRRRRSDFGGNELGEECVAFLTGTLADRWDARGVPIPVWAWTNLLAHGTETLIAESISQPHLHRGPVWRWRTARSYLAYEVLEITQRSSPLVGLQTAVLVPLELDLASRPEVLLWSQRQWVDAVTTALHHQKRTYQAS